MLKGTWRTDVQRTENSMHAVGTVPSEYEYAVVSSFDEFEWVIDSKSWIENVVGNDPILLGIGGKRWKYRILQNEGNVLFVERWMTEDDYEMVKLVLGADGRIELENDQYGYTEYKCRV